MKRGGQLHHARIAYETWGRLNASATNAILIMPGLSPNAHAAHHDSNAEPGWWESMLGPGKPIDTDRWFVICVNSLGSCKGSTGPASYNPITQAMYRLDFPALSIEDGANSAIEVVHALGIKQLASLIGNSMGGMTAPGHPAVTSRYSPQPHQHLRQRAGITVFHRHSLATTRGDPPGTPIGGRETTTTPTTRNRGYASHANLG